MPGKADKPTQNSALQGISEQENFMIKVLFICHGRIRTFVWSGLKSRLLGNENGICTSPLSPYFARVYRDNLKAKLSGWNLLTGLSSIKMNMICGERSSCGGLLFVYKKMSVWMSVKCRFVYMELLHVQSRDGSWGVWTLRCTEMLSKCSELLLE